MAPIRRQRKIAPPPPRPVYQRRRVDRLRHRPPQRRMEPGDVRRAQPALQPRIAALDGLRAVSIAVVLAGHSASTTHAPSLLAPLQHLGILGVELFFAISGFIITLLLIRERRTTGAVSLRNFWLRRALRILPPFAAACGGIALAAMAGVLKWSWPSFAGALSFAKDTPLFGGDWFFGHFWSLSLEEQFYLLWPLLLVALSAGSGSAYPLFGVVLAAPVLAQLCARALPELQNILPFVPDLAAGCLFAVVLTAPDFPFLRWYRRRAWRRQLLTALPMLAVTVEWFRYNGWWPVFTIPLAASLLPCTLFVLLAETVLDCGLLRRGLEHTALRTLGKISYSVYLWQQLFLGPPPVYAKVWFWSAWPQNIVAALACGILAYWLVEKPASRLKRWLGQPQSRHAFAVAG